MKLFIFTAAVVVWAVAISFLLGCTSPRPLCAPHQYGEWRCNKDTVEMCDGGNWSARWQCNDSQRCMVDLQDFALCEEK